MSASQISFGRITHMLEMNFNVLQHFLGSMVALFERLRAVYGDACQLSSRVTRQSLEFGQSSISTASRARSRVLRHPMAAFALFSLCLSALFRLRARLNSRRARHQTVAMSGTLARASLDGVWGSGAAPPS